jgi:hypothetical protein
VQADSSVLLNPAHFIHSPLATRRKMKRKSILIIILGLFLVWLFWNDYSISDSNRPVKKITQTTGLHLFGLKRVFTVSKSIKIYNPDGLLIEWSHFDGDLCDSKYLYEYNDSDQQISEVWLTGNNLTVQRIERRIYDNLNRNTQILLYEISKVHPDTFLYEKTTYYYDSLNRNHKTTIEHLSNMYPSSQYTAVFLDSFDTNNLRVFQKYIAGSTSITKYYYDARRNLIAESGGLLSDSIFYTRNEQGEILKEDRFKDGTKISTKNNWYNKDGYIIKTTNSDSDYGSTFTYQYDKRNRLVKESLTGGIPLIIKPYYTYEYEFY